MKYEKIIKAEFIERPNRFIAVCRIAGEAHEVGSADQDDGIVSVHVKNTGRCRELLVPGATVYLEDFEGRMGTRKMRYSLIGVEKETPTGTLMINMDSQAPNKAVAEALRDGTIELPGMKGELDVKAEKTYGDSRFDFYAVDEKGREAYIEVKGVTLEDKGIVSFPDAPTERGVKHIRELMKAAAEGFGAYVIFIIQMEGMKEFRPNDQTHLEFGDALREASEHGVVILAYECAVGKDFMSVKKSVPVKIFYETN